MVKLVDTPDLGSGAERRDGFDSLLGHKFSLAALLKFDTVVSRSRQVSLGGSPGRPDYSGYRPTVPTAGRPCASG